MAAQDVVMIIGLDPGTRSFKAAKMTATEVMTADNSSLTARGQPSELSGFPGEPESGVTNVPTDMILDKDGKLFKWGHEARAYMDNDQFDPDYYVENAKMFREPGQREKIERSAKLAGTDIPGIIEMGIGAPISFLMDDDDSPLLRSVGGSLNKYKYVDIVVAVPPGWQHHEHEMFEQAINRALGHREGQRVWLASETECVLREWMQMERPETFSEGDVIVVVDLGAGTACISVFLCGQVLAQIESHSVYAGSEVVSNAFEKELRKRLEGVQLENMPKLIHKARQQFNKEKRAVGSKSEKATVTIQVEGLQNDAKKGFQPNSINFTRQEMRAFFEPSLKEFFSKLDDVVSRITAQYAKPKCIIAAGAYASSKLVENKLHETFGKKQKIQIFYPENPKDLVAKGACRARVEGEFKQLCGNVYSIGSASWDFSKEIKRQFPEASMQTIKGRGMGALVLDWAQRKNHPVFSNLNLDHYASLTGVDFLRRVFEPGEPIRFNIMFFVSDEDPRSDRTALRFPDKTDEDWQRNVEDLKERDIRVRLVEFKYDLTCTRKRIGPQEYGPYTRDDLMIDPNDKRRKGGKRVFLDYKPILEPSQVQWRVLIQVNFPDGRMDRLPVGTFSMGGDAVGIIDMGTTTAPADKSLRVDAQPPKKKQRTALPDMSNGTPQSKSSTPAKFSSQASSQEKTASAKTASKSSSQETPATAKAAAAKSASAKSAAKSAPAKPTPATKSAAATKPTAKAAAPPASPAAQSIERIESSPAPTTNNNNTISKSSTPMPDITTTEPTATPTPDIRTTASTASTAEIRPTPEITSTATGDATATPTPDVEDVEMTVVDDGEPTRSVEPESERPGVRDARVAPIAPMAPMLLDIEETETTETTLVERTVTSRAQTVSTDAEKQIEEQLTSTLINASTAKENTPILSQSQASNGSKEKEMGSTRGRRKSRKRVPSSSPEPSEPEGEGDKAGSESDLLGFSSWLRETGSLDPVDRSARDGDEGFLPSASAPGPEGDEDENASLGQGHGRGIFITDSEPSQENEGLHAGMNDDADMTESQKDDIPLRRPMAPRWTKPFNSLKRTASLSEALPRASSVPRSLARPTASQPTATRGAGANGGGGGGVVGSSPGGMTGGMQQYGKRKRIRLTAAAWMGDEDGGGEA